MVTKAQQRNPDTPIHHADICQWTLPHRYDFISAWDSIWHVPLEQQATLIEKLLAGLTPGGVLIFSFGGTTAADSHTDDNMGQSLYYATLGVHGFLDLIGDGFQCRHLEFDQYPELHAYMIVQRIMSSNA